MGHGVEILVILLLVSAAVGLAVKWVRLPYSITLVIVGLAIGASHQFPSVEMTPDVILLACLPALLFEASWNLRLPELKLNWKPISVLASVGVIITMCITGFILHECTGISLQRALLFGALIAATDPISVLALFRKLGIDRRLALVIEGESLFNDGTAVVLFNIVLMTVLGNEVVTPLSGAVEFVRTVALGAIVGSGVGYFGSRITRYFDDHLLEIMLTTIMAYGSYLIADQLHASAVIAVVSAGIVVGNYGSRTAMSASTRLAVNSFWEYAAFVVNSLVFLLIGLQINIDLLIAHAFQIGVGILGIIVSRLVVVYGLCPFLNAKRLPIPMNWRHLLFWGSLRGSLSMALALSLPLSFAFRNELIVITFGVVLFTLIVQGLTVEPLVRFLGMMREDDRLKVFQKLKGELHAEAIALAELEELFKRGSITETIYEKIKLEITTEQARLRERLEELHLTDSLIETIQLNEVRKHLLESKKDSIVQLMREESAHSDALDELVMEIDQRLDNLYTQERMEEDVVGRRSGSEIEAIAIYLTAGMKLERGFCSGSMEFKSKVKIGVPVTDNTIKLNESLDQKPETIKLKRPEKA